MGIHCGFYFYKLVDGKLEDANVVANAWSEDENKLSNWLQIDGRCDATKIFLNLVTEKEPNIGWFEKRKPEERYTAYLLLNHPELDGFQQNCELSKCYGEEYEGWVDKYFYIGVSKFKSQFDFEEAQKTHNACIQDYKDSVLEDKKEIELLRTHQEKAKTKVAFDGFEEKINELKENISSAKEAIREFEEDDYDYEHYMTIKSYIEKVEKVITEQPDVIAVAFAND